MRIKTILLIMFDIFLKNNLKRLKYDAIEEGDVHYYYDLKTISTIKNIIGKFACEVLRTVNNFYNNVIVKFKGK